MKTLAIAALFAALAACSSVHRAGAPVSAREPVPAVTLLHHPELYDGKTVVVEAPVFEVCPKKGCWMVLQEGDRSMRVTFKDYAFFVPKDCAGQIARVEGLFAVKDVPVAEARHYLEDAGRHEEAARITEPVKSLTLVATGVELRCPAR